MKIQLPIKIIIPGNPIVKKNSEHVSLFYKDKHGRKIPRDQPIKFPSKAYKEWARIAVQTCATYKTKHTDWDFPIQEQMNMKCIFYFDRNTKVDLSNLYEGVQDVFAGCCKLFKGVHPAMFQIIEDDNTRFIGSHDGSRVLLDYVKPRMEITLERFKL